MHKNKSAVKISNIVGNNSKSNYVLWSCYNTGEDNTDWIDYNENDIFHKSQSFNMSLITEHSLHAVSIFCLLILHITCMFVCLSVSLCVLGIWERCQKWLNRSRYQFFVASSSIIEISSLFSSAMKKLLFVWNTHTHPFYSPLDYVQDYSGEPVSEPVWILLKQEYNGGGVCWCEWLADGCG